MKNMAKSIFITIVCRNNQRTTPTGKIYRSGCFVKSPSVKDAFCQSSLISCIGDEDCYLKHRMHSGG